MNEVTYTIKEMLDVQFKAIDEKLDNIHDILKDQNVNSEKRFNQIEKDIDELKADNTRFKTIWAMGATIGGGLIAFFLNRIF